MTIWQFEAALWSLKELDMRELVDAGAMHDRDYVTWDAFKRNPVDWFLSHPAKSNAVWRAITRHKLRSQKSEPPRTADNIVAFDDARRGKR